MASSSSYRLVLENIAMSGSISWTIKIDSKKQSHFNSHFNNEEVPLGLA